MDPWLRKYLSAKALVFSLCMIVFALLCLITAGGDETVHTTAGLYPDASEGALIVVDAGHGGGDGGSVGRTGTVEAGLNLDVAIMLRDALLERGLRVVMTREDENALGDTKREDMAQRRKILNTEGAEICVSVHMNSFGDHNASGPMAFYMKGSDKGRELAECVIASVCEAVEHPLRKANPGDYFVIRECVCPAVLVECGFLSNASEEKLLSDHEYRVKLANGICEGVCEYLEKTGCAAAND